MVLRWTWKAVNSIPLNLPTLILGVLGLLVAFNQFRLAEEVQHFQERDREIERQMKDVEIRLVEGQLAAGLMSSVVAGDENERKLAWFILNRCAPSVADSIVSLVLVQDPSEEVRQAVRKDYNEVRFTAHVSRARELMNLRRYESAATHFVDALQYVDTGLIDSQVSQAAMRRYEAGAFEPAAELFDGIIMKYEAKEVGK